MTSPDFAVLDVELTRAMTQNLRRIALTIPPRTRFLTLLVQHGAAGAWRRIARTASSGFTDLYEAGLLHLSLEALVIDNPKFHPLFSARELLLMRHALLQHGYPVKPVLEFGAERMSHPA